MWKKKCEKRKEFLPNEFSVSLFALVQNYNYNVSNCFLFSVCWLTVVNADTITIFYIFLLRITYINKFNFKVVHNEADTEGS